MTQQNRANILRLTGGAQVHRFFSLAFVLHLTMLLTTSEAATYYVRTTGSDANAGTSVANAWRHVDYAASNVAAGDTVYVGAGTYFDEINMTSGASGTAADPIRFIADTDGSQTGDTGDVTLDGITGETIWVENIDYIHFIGFRITNGSDAGVLWRNSTGGLLQNCYIYDTGDDGVETQDLVNFSIIDCTIVNVPDDGLDFNDNTEATVTGTIIIDSGDNGVLTVESGSDISLSRCVISGSDDRGIHVDDGTLTVVNCLIDGSNHHGIHIDNDASTDVTIWHTTVVNNGSAGLSQQNGTATITNSIIAFNTNQGLLTTGVGSLTHTYNLVFSNQPDYAGTSADSTEISADPQFVGGGDYHILAISPAANAGTDSSSVTAVDIDGQPRPSGSGYEMGCDERNPPKFVSWREPRN